MKCSPFTLLNLSITAMLPAASSATLFPHGTPNICLPDLVKGTSVDGTLPPCVEMANIELMCEPNGTESLDFEAHAQCMCKGSFFADWRGCQNCLLLHGYRSERDNIYWENVLTAASEALCTGTPTAWFPALFAAARSDTVRAPLASTGDPTSSDWFPGNSAVSLYYTATSQQGPGEITGAPALATAGHPIPLTGEIVPSSGSNQTRNGTAVLSGNLKNPKPTSPSVNGAPVRRSGLAIAIAGAALVAAL